MASKHSPVDLEIFKVLSEISPTAVDGISTRCISFVTLCTSPLVGLIRAMGLLRRAGRLGQLAPSHRHYATVSHPQTLIEKIVQSYAVDLSPGTKVRSGDYIMIRPAHV